MLGELLPHTIRIGFGLVDLVDCHNQRNTCRTRMRDGLHGLRHHTVISRNHQHHDVRGFRTTGTHCSKRCVTRRIQEGDRSLGRRDLIGTDVLSDAAGLSGSHFGGADVVE